MERFFLNVCTIPGGMPHLDIEDVMSFVTVATKHKLFSFENGKELMEFVKLGKLREVIGNRDALCVIVRQKEWFDSDELFSSLHNIYALIEEIKRCCKNVKVGCYGCTVHEGTKFESLDESKCYLHIFVK